MKVSSVPAQILGNKNMNSVCFLTKFKHSLRRLLERLKNDLLSYFYGWSYINLLSTVFYQRVETDMFLKNIIYCYLEIFWIICSHSETDVSVCKMFPHPWQSRFPLINKMLSMGSRSRLQTSHAALSLVDWTFRWPLDLEHRSQVW